MGYGFGLQEALRGNVIRGPVVVGIVSNGGACLYLLYFGFTGAWATWGAAIQFVCWSSVLATTLITLGLFRYGLLTKSGAQSP